MAISSGLPRWAGLSCICLSSVPRGAFSPLMDREEESWGAVPVGGGGGKFMNLDHVKRGMNGIIMPPANLFERVQKMKTQSGGIDEYSSTLRYGVKPSATIAFLMVLTFHNEA